MTSITLPGRRVSRRTLTIAVVWLGLTIATCLSWWVATDHRMVDARILSGVIILVTAFIKIRFVGNYFMELRNAPVALRVFFEGYCIAVSALIIAMYLWA